MLFHLAEPAAWDRQTDHPYFPDGFVTEGFIHLSSPTQVAATFHRYYSTRDDLVLLTIDDQHQSVVESLRWEASTGGDLFPHLYAHLPRDCVVNVQRSWQPDPTAD
jgi:uncharacterized protein (DUF952 family)